ncbi:MAG: hypothetical protein H0U40_10435 [Chloroflexia bacterium]|nr:hypothetical protein [Chloroflexia bacterium]MDQ3513543.1 hypothetical protein [Chloroflexota bacterium]
MNVVDGLKMIRQRLDANGAVDETLALVDLIIKRASLPAAASAAAQSQLQLVRMLMRTPVADANTAIYNDLARLEEEIENVSTRRREEQEALDSRPEPKTKKFYKDLKEKAKSERG